MFSPQRITTATAVALAAGAIAAPAVSAMPIGGNPPPTAKPAATMTAHFHHPLGGPNHSVPVAANPLGSPTYSQQDKQAAPPATVPVSNHPVARIGPPHVFATRGPVNSGDAALSVGGVVLSILGLGGVLALSERRTRKPAGVRTGKPTVASA